MCRSRRELSNEYLLAKIGVDTAENEPLEVWGENSIQYSLHSLRGPGCRRYAGRGPSASWLVTAGQLQLGFSERALKKRLGKELSVRESLDVVAGD